MASGCSKMALTRVDTHGCADLEANPFASSVNAQSGEHPEPDVEMSEPEALVSFAREARRLQAQMRVGYSSLRSQGGALHGALNGGQVSSLGACAAGHVPCGSRAQRRGSPSGKGGPWAHE